MNKIIKTFMKRKLQSSKGEWVEKLPEVLWAIQTTPTAATGVSHYSLSFGSEAVIPTELLIQTRRVSTTTLRTMRKNYEEASRKSRNSPVSARFPLSLAAA